MDKLVLSLCDLTGNMVAPWAEAGYECLCVDIGHDRLRKDGNITYIEADIRNWLPPKRDYAIVFAFPPCDNLAVSGARWFKEKGLRGLIEGLELVERCRQVCEWAGAPWMIENPVSTISTYWREPDHSFDPCDYGGYLDPPGDRYTKRTCIWIGSGFKVPKTKRVRPSEGSKMSFLPPSRKRARIRSATPHGFANAVFLSNANKEADDE